MEKKKLKKLELKKQTIVELSDFEAAQVKGGTVDSISLCAFEWLENHSTWCWISPEQPTGDNVLHIGPNGEAICVISEVMVYGLYGYGG